MQRRNFIKYGRLSLTAVGAEAKGTGLSTSGAKRVRFGLITDVHEDLQKDATLRMREFVQRANEEKVDFVIQLGDLCHSTGVDKISAEYREKHNYATDWTYIYPVISDRLIKW